MSNATTVPAVEDDETLARFVLDRTYVRKVDGTLKAAAFMPARDQLLSVYRHRLLDEPGLWEIGTRIALDRDRALQGRAGLVALALRARELNIDPSPPLPHHADVSGWPHEKSHQMEIARELAGRARFVPAANR